MLLCLSEKTTHLPRVTLSNISLPEEPPWQGVKVEVDHVASEDKEDMGGWLLGLEIRQTQPVAKPAGIVSNKSPAAMLPLELESMWDEVIHNICDGRVLDAAAGSRMRVLNGKAAECARTWPPQLGKQLAANRCFQQRSGCMRV